jgi:hypothetical protein
VRPHELSPTIRLRYSPHGGQKPRRSPGTASGRAEKVRSRQFTGATHLSLLSVKAGMSGHNRPTHAELSTYDWYTFADMSTLNQTDPGLIDASAHAAFSGGLKPGIKEGHIERFLSPFDADGRLLFGILSIEAIALFIARLPGTLQFNNFAFFDIGANLTVQYLTAHGYRPAVDFSYHYGLLPLLFGRAWFALFGLTPNACVATVPFFDLLTIWGLVRFAKNLRAGPAGVFLLVLNASLIIPSSFLNLTHAIEPIFIIHAVADQSAGNRRRALALAAACVFVKPSMAFFLGGILIIFIFVHALRVGAPPITEIFRESYPAIALGGMLTAAFGLTYGSRSLLHTILPLEGISMYRAQGFGFFNRAGRLFLAPPGSPWTYYLANPAGPWLLYTAALIVGAMFAIRPASQKVAERLGAGRACETVATCAFLHISFLSFFFGNEFSWLYYFYIPVLGLAAAARFGCKWALTAILIALSLPASKAGKAVILRMATAGRQNVVDLAQPSEQTPKIAALPVEAGFTVQLWTSTRPSLKTAGLWAAPSEREEWTAVRALTENHHTAILAYYGCASLLFPQFDPPVSLYLVPGGIDPSELAREIDQLNSADMVVMPRWQSGLLDEEPAIGKLIRRNFAISHDGPAFLVFAHRKN